MYFIFNFFKKKWTLLAIIIILIIVYYLMILIIFIRNKQLKKNLKLKKKIKQKIIKNMIPDNKECIYIKNQLKKRIQPLDFENEFIFFASLISCKIPFSFIRFGDGENDIMKGELIASKQDTWLWDPKNQKFRNSLIESSNICLKENNFIGIPCKNWIKISESILSFSNCTSAKFMSYATLFINKNYKIFKDWIFNFIKISNRWKIILIANKIINQNISWAYKFFPIPDKITEIWDNYSITLLPKLSNEAKRNNLIFFISAGPAANIIISYLIKINKNNIYIDFGSSIEFITKGYSTRPYSKNNNKYSIQSCESFYLTNKTLIYNI